jgi:integrase
MAAHIIKREDRGGTWYLAEGELYRSLKTKSKGEAEFKLREYVKGKWKPGKQITVGEYYETWINIKNSLTNRKSNLRDYRQHFTAYLLASFARAPLSTITVTCLVKFQASLSERVSLKTTRNVIDGSFRALWRSAREGNLVEHDPFVLLKWPRRPKSRPDPFTAEERQKILAYIAENDGFYYPWVLTLFYTGMRPSEASALRWSDVDLETGTIVINKSRYMGDEGATKTAGSDRIIGVYDFVVQSLRCLNSAKFGSEYVFINKYVKPINSKKWGEHYWRGIVEGSDVRYRKFYATRHTFITEMVKSKRNLKEIADYCGTSVQMIEQNYCGRLDLKLNPTVFQPPASESTKTPYKTSTEMVAGPGFELVPHTATKWEQALNPRKIKNGQSRKVA